MNFRIVIKILILLISIFKNCECFCNRTAEFRNTNLVDQPFTNIYHQTLTIIKILKSRIQTTKLILTTSTTFPITTATTTTTQNVNDNMVRCAQYMKKSNVFGSSNPNSISFSITTSQLSSMTVYSGHQVEAILFNFTNGVSKIYGNPSNNALNVAQLDLVNNQIVAANIGYDTAIESIQFLLYQNITGQYTWTKRMGGKRGSQVIISLPVNAPNARSFKISSIFGSANSQQILTLSMAYTVKECTPLFNIQTIPPTPPPNLETTTIKIQ